MLKKSYMRRTIAMMGVSAVLLSSVSAFAWARPNGMLYASDNPIVADEPIEAYPETREGLNKGDTFKAPGNPYLPLWEFIPDGEPYIFDDPDKPGEQRVYVYGSHDMRITEYCGDDQVVWSANVNDLTTWRYDGKIFENFDEVTNQPDLLYAPDVIEAIENGKKVYYLYVDTQKAERLSMVAKSDRPDGPFRIVNWRAGESPKVHTVGPLHFDPGVLWETDEQGNEHVYAYFGFNQNRENPGGSWFAELDPDNKATLKEGTTVEKHIPRANEAMWHRNRQPLVNDSNRDQYVFPKDNDRKGERTVLPEMDAEGKDADGKIVWQFNTYGPDKDPNWYKWCFFEASSIRKVGNKYVYIYSRTNQDWLGERTGSNINQLAYGYSDNPWGPWKFGGIIVDSQGELIEEGGKWATRTTRGGNTHGSICKLGDDWYVFYHRNIHNYGRQAMADRLEFADDIDTNDGFNWNVENGVRWTEESVADGGKVEIARAEVTSEGFYKDGLNPFEKHSAGIACYFPDKSDGQESQYFSPNYNIPAEGEELEMPMHNIKDGTVMGVKYFDFRSINENKSTKKYLLNLELVPKGGAAEIGIYLRPKSAVDTPVAKDSDGKITSVGEGSEKVATVNLTEEMARVKTKVSVQLDSAQLDKLNDPKYGLFFAFNSDQQANICDLYTMQIEESNTELGEQTATVIGDVAQTTDIKLTNVGTNRVLSTENANRGSNTLTTEAASDSNLGQKWSISAVNAEADKKLYYLTDWSDEMVLCVPNALKTEDAPISIYANTAAADQQWKPELMKIENGKYYYRIINGNSNLALTALGEADEYKVVQKEYRGEDNQLWEMNVLNGDWTHGAPVDEYKVTEKKYFFNTDTINSDGTYANIEWQIPNAPQYFYVDTVDVDKIKSIELRAGYKTNNAEIAVYTYDNNNQAVTKDKLQGFKTDTTGLTRIASYKTTKTGDWGYSTALFDTEGITLTEGSDIFTLDTTNSSKLDIGTQTGKKALVVGITGDLGGRQGKGYFDYINIEYTEPVLDKIPVIRNVTGEGIIDELVEVDKDTRTVKIQVLKGTDISQINPEIITDYRATTELTGTWADGTITLTFGDNTESKSENWKVTTKECSQLKQYLTAPYCVKHENAGDQTNASLGGTPQIHIDAGVTAKLVVNIDYLDLFSAAKIGYAQNNGTMNVKLSVSDTLDGDATQVASYDMPSASGYDSRITEEKTFTSDITGKKYLIVEVTPTTAEAWIDYVELISKEEQPKQDIELNAENGTIKYTVNCDTPEGAVMYTALYNKDGILLECDMDSKNGTFTVPQSGKYTVKAFVWDNNMKPLQGVIMKETDVIKAE